ncbi:MAG: TIGR04283 family arsenosugar biosynthesis glycosyltransferase [Holophagales bacterium]|nr:TIGR04283 family arsenosugar biosynthesis glycosyltransferase [Holophagales bacterium]
MAPSLSAVVPTLDEARELPATLAALSPEVDEIVVADGGSLDATRSLARAGGARVVEGARGRGAQLNLGAREAAGEWLWFVHADTRVPPGSGEAVRAALAAGALGGAFEIRFEADGWRYALGGDVASARSRWFRIFLGDQAPFVARATFERLRGFAPWPLFEDLDFCRRLRAQGPLAILEPAVRTSARRFAARGPLRAVLENWWLTLLFLRGVSPERLTRRYLAPR